jgi:hypothetical protein
MPDKVLRSLEKRAAVQPVFRYHDAILVVMPEVRVELAKGQRKKLESLVSAGALRSQIEIDSNGNLVLRPVSGKGTDALALANVLHEKIGPPLAQARFLRVVRSPRVQRSQAVG